MTDLTITAAPLRVSILRIAFAALLAALLLPVNAASAEEAADTGKDEATPEATEEEEEKWDVTDPFEGLDATPVSIDVTEGTWMNLDVSPDGQTIAFDLLGDIYTLPITGGEATVISSGHAWDFQPRFSPDGTKIAFISDRAGGENIWVMDAGGANARAITEETFRLLNNPAWSPDGQYIAARKHFTTRRSMGTGEIWIHHVAGGKGIAAFERPTPLHQKDTGEPIYAPSSSGAGSAIYFSMNTTPGGTFEYAQDSNRQIYQIRRLDLTDGSVTNVVSGPGGAVRPTPSPDGRYMAFVRRVRAKSSLFLKDLESGETRMLYRDLDQDNQETWGVVGVYPNMDWTPDSKSIVFYARGKIRRIDIGGGEAPGNAVVIPFHVADTRDTYAPPRPEVAVAPDRFSTKMTRWGQLSPDGRTILFESLGRLYLRDAAGGNARRLTRDGDDHFEAWPAYSRDGKWIVFVSWDDEKLGAVRKVRARGGRSEVLTGNPGHYISPQMSPDGRIVVFQRVAGGRLTSGDWSENTGIWRVAASGGGAAALVTRDGSAPHFGATSDRVFFGRVEEMKHLFYSSDIAGNDERALASSEFATEMVISPDGDYLAYREGYHVYVTPLPQAGKAVEVGPKASATPNVRISRDGGTFVSWAADSGAVRYSTGATLYSVALAEALAISEDDFSPPEPSAGMDMSMAVFADKPSGIVALTGARLITMAAGDQHVIASGTIVLDGNRIVAVGPEGSVDIPSDAQVMDFAGKTIIPGLIDTHAHGPYGTNLLIPEQNWASYATLAFGVTTIMDPSSRAAHVFTAAEYQRAGRIIAPRIYSTGEIIYGAKHELWASIESYDDALAHVRRLKAQGAIAVKNYNQPRRNQRQQVVAAARAENMLVVPEGGANYYMDMSLIADGNSSIEHSLPNQAIYEDVLQFWGATDVVFNQTLVVNYGGISGEDYMYQISDVWKHPLLARFVPPHILQPRSVRRQMAPIEDYAHFDDARIGKALLDRGVSVVTGAHGQREGLATHWEMWLFADGGATAMEALHAATILPARHLGMAADIGSLEVGKLGDLVVLNANPLEDIRNSDQVSHVMVNGRLYEAETMNEVLTGDHRTRPFYWWGKPEAEIR